MIVLSGGPLAGQEINAPGWVIGARMYFTLDDGVTECTYWRYNDILAVFEGMGRAE